MNTNQCAHNDQKRKEKNICVLLIGIYRRRQQNIFLFFFPIIELTQSVRNALFS